MSPLNRLGSLDDKTDSLPQVHIALTDNDMVLIGENCQDILLKNQQVFVDEKGRVGLVPTVMNRISDRCGAIPLEGKVISYFSAREQDFVNIGQYPLDRDYVVHPDDIICLTPPLSSNEPVISSQEQPMMPESLAIKAQGSLDANFGKCMSPRVTSNGMYVLDYE